MRKSIINNCDVSNQIRNQVAEFRLDWKVEDSYNILLYIMFSYKFKLTIEERELFDSVNKNYIIVVDKEIEDDAILTLDLSLTYLAETSTEKDNIDKIIAFEMIGAIENIRPYYFLICKPKLVSSIGIDEIYKALCCS